MSFDLPVSGSAAFGTRLERWISILRFSHWTIGTRISALVLALVVPLNLVIFAAIWHLADAASQAQRTSLLYTARSVAASMDGKLGEYIALAQLLSRSPALLDHNLDAFEAEARRAFLSIEDGWVVVANIEGQQLINTARPADQNLPMRNPAGLAAQRRALETHSTVVSDVQLGTVSRTWLISIEVPVFKDGLPFRALSVTLKAKSFLHLLNEQQIPPNWIATIIDRQGRIIARVPGHETRAGQLAAEGWRKVMHEDGVFEFLSLDGDPIVSAHARSPASGWLAGIKIKKAEMQAAVWSTIRWAALFGGGLSILSLLLANALSRRIAGPIAEIRQKATMLLTGPVSPTPPGPPEVCDLWNSLKQSANKQAEAHHALVESEQRFRATFENAAVGVAHVAPDGSWLLVNRRLCQILGYTPEEILTKRFQDITHPDHLEADLTQLRSMLDREINSFSTEKRYLRKDGSAVWARLTVGAVRKGDGHVNYFISVVEDISERKLADKALRESEERFRGIYEHAATAIVITDMQGRLQSCNPAYAAMLGYSENELRGLEFSGLVHLEDRDANLQQVRHLISQEIPSFEIVNRYFGKDSKVIWAHKHCSVLRDANGHASSMIALVTDITARKRYEEQIRESEQQLQLALDAAQLGTWRRDLNQDANTLLCDARCEALLDLPPGLPVRYETFLNAILPEDRAQVKTAVARALDPADPRDDYACEYRVRHSGGTVLWISSMGRAYFETDPASSCGRRAVFMAGILYDVTERHLAKAARESEERFRHLGDSLPDNAVYRYADEADGTSRFHYISAGIEQLNGVRVEDVLSDAGVLLGQILPDHLPRLIEAEKRSASEMSDFKMEVPMRRPDGEMRWMRLQCRPHRGKNGTVIWDGVQTDITNQRRAEQALRASEEKLRLALGAPPSLELGAGTLPRAPARSSGIADAERCLACRWMLVSPTRFGPIALCLRTEIELKPLLPVPLIRPTLTTKTSASSGSGTPMARCSGSPRRAVLTLSQTRKPPRDGVWRSRRASSAMSRRSASPKQRCARVKSNSGASSKMPAPASPFWTWSIGSRPVILPTPKCWVTPKKSFAGSLSPHMCTLRIGMRTGYCVSGSWRRRYRPSRSSIDMSAKMASLYGWTSISPYYATPLTGPPTSSPLSRT